MLAVLKVWPLLTSLAVASCVSISLLLSFNIKVFKFDFRSLVK